jgi:NAD(P)H-flavin reductase
VTSRNTNLSKKLYTEVVGIDENVSRICGNYAGFYEIPPPAWTSQIQKSFINRSIYLSLSHRRFFTVKKILDKEQLSEEVFRMKFEALLIARERKADQFIIIQLDTEFGERIPLTIADADPEEGSVTIIFQTVGSTTHVLAELNPGDHIQNVLGPLGQPTHIENYGTVVIYPEFLKLQDTCTGK